jgi:hypothetical protein
MTIHPFVHPHVHSWLIIKLITEDASTVMNKSCRRSWAMSRCQEPGGNGPFKVTFRDIKAHYENTNQTQQIIRPLLFQSRTSRREFSSVTTLAARPFIKCIQAMWNV